jgi:SAM-dependent methyltransferase
MFGTGDSFHYDECADCGALSINHVPSDLSRHYPSNYYSLQAVAPHGIKTSSVLDSLRASALGSPSINNRIKRLLSQTALSPSAHILDVGCGSGSWLHQLQQQGFEHLHGVDPYLTVEQETHGAINLCRGTIHDTDRDYDLIAYHHVLEHIADPRAEIAAAKSHLKPGGYLLVRVPVADCWARRTFETSWVQWDAPRHLWLPTRAALSSLATENGLTEISCIEDSTGFQTWGSRRYRAHLNGGIGKYSPFDRRRGFVLSLTGLIVAKYWAAWLNLRRQGDQVAVLWQRPLS